MIIDTHVHFGKCLDFNLSQKTVLDAMEKYGIDRAIVSNIQAAECDKNQNELPEHLQFDMLSTAKNTIDFAKANPGRIYAAIWVKPRLEQPTAELEYLLKIHPEIVKAIKVHPFHSAMPFDGPETEAFIQLAETLDLPVITHSAGDDCSSPQRVAAMAKKYPHVKFILAHLGLGTDNEEAIELCSHIPNLYGDTAWVPVENAIKFIKRAGSEKLMFGSDMPIDGLDTYAKNRYGQPSMYVPYFNELESKIPQTSFENVMWKNALEFYKL